MKTVTMSLRINPTLKKESEYLFSELGMSLSTAITVFLRQSVREGGMPFTPSFEVPNKETIEAIEEGERIAHDPNAKTYDSVEELFADMDLENDEED